MPPSKSSSMKQRTLNFKSVKRNIPSVKSNIKSVKQGFKSVKQNKKFKLKLKREQIDPTATAVKKPRGRAAQNAKLAKCDMHVKLHIPVSICKNLPSVKTNLSSDMKKSSKQVSSSQEQRGAGVYKRHTASPGIKVEAESDENGHLAKPLLGAKKRRGEVIKYQLHLQKEEKFKGMIFDVALGASGDIVVTCTEEAVLCDSFLKRKRTLEKVMSPGGAAFLRTGEILVVCRCSDNVNMFTANGMYKRSFNCGPSPCGITVNNLDEIIITDTGAKLVRFYARDGSLIRTIEPTGPSYLLRWPIYATTNSQDDVIVSDCHQQKVLVFDESGGFKSHFQLRTQGGNQVLMTGVANELKQITTAKETHLVLKYPPGL